MAPCPLAVAGLGMVSSLGAGSEANAAAFRCGYDGFQIPRKGKVRYRYAPAPLDPAIRGLSRLVVLTVPAINEALENLNEKSHSLPVLFCLAEETRPGCHIASGYPERLIEALNQEVNIDLYHPESSYYCAGRAGFASALRDAQRLCTEQEHEFVLIVGIDNLTTSSAINAFMGGNHSPCRLLTPDNSDGFIPGEAATALLLSRSGHAEEQTWITGVGLAKEPAPLDSEEVHTSRGLTEAIRNAAIQAGTQVADTDFVIAGLSGESWFFVEASNAIHRTMEHTRATHPLWHPADSIGEVGAAIGPAIVVMAHYAFSKGYAPGPKALCHLSNDDHRRGAFILEHLKESHHG
jgi:3-oxoacyl-[acyl-carrier-protein] synthase I